MAKRKQKNENRPESYADMVFKNEENFKVLLKNLRPDIFVLMDLLDNTQINSYIIFHIIKHLNNILIGTKYGNVTITIENGKVTYVSGHESTKLDESLRKSSSS